MIPWKRATAAELGRIRGVCLDIDDTLSTRGKLTAQAYSALWSLRDAGLAIVPITGRPAGWCDQIARFWPVDAVIGENGAFTFFMRNGVRSRIDTPAGAGPAALKAKLTSLGEKIRKRFAHARWASDQPYREYDLAIDFCEDVPPWPRTDVDELLKICAAEGAHAKVSSIHVNAWFGDYDKRKGFEHWVASGHPGLAGQAPKKAPKTGEWLFIGDSPNDEPMFAAFSASVGVANLAAFADRLKTPPKWITSKESGAGFAEMAASLVKNSTRK